MFNECEIVSTREIRISDKEHIETIRRKYSHELSSHAFASLYLWQNEMELSLYPCGDFFTARCGMQGDNSWLFPCGSEEAVYGYIRDNMDSEGFSLCYMRECDMKWLEERFPGKWNFSRETDSDEYVCDIRGYIEMEGSRFAEIRRRLRQLEKNHIITVKSLSDSTVGDALSVIFEWDNFPHRTGIGNISDDNVSVTAVNCRELLDINGVIIYVDGRPASVFAGFPLSGDTVDVLVGKAVPEAPKGLAYYALREYLKLLDGKYLYFNNEEDLGIQGIRNMKKSLCPIRMNEIWEAVRK